MKLIVCYFVFLVWNIQYSAGEVNLALYKPAFQSSTRNERGPSRVVDGDLGTSIENCTATDQPAPGVPNWWLVDLQDYFTIREIRILNRIHQEDRLTNFTISVWNYDPGPYIKNEMGPPMCLCYYFTDNLGAGSWANLTCRKYCSGRFVLFVLHRTTVLTLCELQVYGYAVNGTNYPSRLDSLMKRCERQKAVPVSQQPVLLQTKDVLHCAISCLQDNMCLSFNFGFVAESDNCQLFTVFIRPVYGMLTSGIQGNSLGSVANWTWVYLRQ